MHQKSRIHDSFLSRKDRESLPRRIIRLVVVGLEGHQAKRNTNQYIYCYVVLSCALDMTEATKLELRSSPALDLYFLLRP